MQPQQPEPPSSSPQYDFILKDGQKQQKKFKLPLAGLPRPALYILGAAVVLLTLITLFAILSSGRTSGSQPITDVMARAQEINRISVLVQPLAKNVDTKGLAATTQITLSSEQNELVDYLKSKGIKTDLKKLTAHLNKSTDTQMQAAAQNNALDSTYASYLKQQLISYQSSLTSASQGASREVTLILNAALSSVKTLLSAPQLATASN